MSKFSSKQMFARWQAILSAFNFELDYIKGENNSLSYFLTREILQDKIDQTHFWQKSR